MLQLPDAYPFWRPLHRLRGSLTDHMTPPRALTANCTRHDCRIESHGASMTLSARVPTYDKDGTAIGGNDPNVVTIHYFCATCRKKWNVARQTGQEDKITLTEPDA